MVRGGLIDGPVYRKVFQGLRGVFIREPDPFAAVSGRTRRLPRRHQRLFDKRTHDGWNRVGNLALLFSRG